MSEAPERIWLAPKDCQECGYPWISTLGRTSSPSGFIGFIRADLHAAEVEALRSALAASQVEVARLQEALVWRCSEPKDIDAPREPGYDEWLDAAPDHISATIAEAHAAMQGEGT